MNREVTWSDLGINFTPREKSQWGAFGALWDAKSMKNGRYFEKRPEPMYEDVFAGLELEGPDDCVNVVGSQGWLLGLWFGQSC